MPHDQHTGLRRGGDGGVARVLRAVGHQLRGVAQIEVLLRPGVAGFEEGGVIALPGEQLQFSLRELMRLGVVLTQIQKHGRWQIKRSDADLIRSGCCADRLRRRNRRNRCGLLAGLNQSEISVKLRAPLKLAVANLREDTAAFLVNFRAVDLVTGVGQGDPSTSRQGPIQGVTVLDDYPYRFDLTGCRSAGVPHAVHTGLDTHAEHPQRWMDVARANVEVRSELQVTSQLRQRLNIHIP